MTGDSWLERRRTEKLRQSGGRSAIAQVVGFDQRSAHTSSNDEGTFHETKRSYTLSLRVQPDGEPSFEAQLSEKSWDDGHTIPKPDDWIAVLYDPGDPAHVLRDDSIEGRQAANRAQFPHGSAPTVTPGGLGAAVDPTSHLEELAVLHASGALTDEEFAAAKAQALGSG